MKRFILFAMCLVALASAAHAEDEVKLSEEDAKALDAIRKMIDTTVAPEDDKAARLVLQDYLKAVAAENVKKGLALCRFDDKDQEKLCRLSIESDIATAKLRGTVEKKFGKDAWGKMGERLGEFTSETPQQAKITRTAGRLSVRWNIDTKLPADEAMHPGLLLRHTDKGLRIDLEGVVLLPEQYRRITRDMIGEIGDITAEIESGELKTAEDVEKAVVKLVAEIKQAYLMEEAMRKMMNH